MTGGFGVSTKYGRIDPLDYDVHYVSQTSTGENRVMHVLRQIAPKAARAKQMVELLDGLMSRASVYRSLESLEKSGEVEKHQVRGAAHRPYAVYRVITK
jgi:predicted transcriptional regulator